MVRYCLDSASNSSCWYAKDRSILLKTFPQSKWLKYPPHSVADIPLRECICSLWLYNCLGHNYLGATQLLLPTWGIIPFRSWWSSSFSTSSLRSYGPGLGLRKVVWDPSCTLTLALKSVILPYRISKFSVFFKDIREWSDAHRLHVSSWKSPSSLRIFSGASYAPAMEVCLLWPQLMEVTTIVPHRWLEPWAHSTQGFCPQWMRPHEWRLVGTENPSICHYKCTLGSKSKRLLCLVAC